jgi:choline dehydrogenase-like flavoprotein
MSSGRVPWGEGHHEAFAEIFDRTAGMVAICEDLPEAHNRVTLDPELADAHGIPAPKIDYTLSENSRKMCDHAVARAREVLEAAGAKDVLADPLLSVAGWHLMGTARMGTDPARSVVDAHGRSHDVKNLFIVDGSVFPTSAAVNPTNTIQAFALHVADHMKRNLENLFD